MNPIVTKLVQDRAALELDDRQGILSLEIAGIKERSVMAGGLSSRTVIAIQEAIKQEARVRATLVWTALARALSSAREALTPTLAQEARGLISRLVREHSSDFQRHLEFAAKLGHRFSGLPTDPLDEAFTAAFERINSEVDFALLASVHAGSDALPQVVNIYQSQGIVQTGYQASATIAINLSTEEREGIRLALSSVREALEQDSGLPAIEKRQALELLDDTAAEVEKGEPNRLKIRSGLQGVATTIQALAAAPRVWQLIKGAGALVGLDLP